MATFLRLTFAVILTVCAGSGPSGSLGATVRQSTTTQGNRVWAAVSVNSPIIRPGEHVNVTFAAVNLSNAPILATRLREDTVLIINGKEGEQSRFNFTNGLHSSETHVQPGRSMLFLYQLTEVFKAPGLYRIQWKGPEFETLPIEFRVLNSAY